MPNIFKHQSEKVGEFHLEKLCMNKSIAVFFNFSPQGFCLSLGFEWMPSVKQSAVQNLSFAGF